MEETRTHGHGSTGELSSASPHEPKNDRDESTLQGEEVDLAMDRDLEKRLHEVEAQRSSSTGLPTYPSTLALDDPEHPINWSTRKKVWADIALCAFVLSLTYASTSYVSRVQACSFFPDRADLSVPRLPAAQQCRSILTRAQK
jgi:hypothetical protein